MKQPGKNSTRGRSLLRALIVGVRRFGLVYAGNLRCGAICMSFDITKRASLKDSTKLESVGRIVVSRPNSPGRANDQSRKPRTSGLRWFALAHAIISDTPT